MPELAKTIPAKPTDRRYASVTDLMRGEGVPTEVQKMVAELAKETRASRQLAAMRIGAGLTQEEMANRLGVTQSCISKYESDRDDELTMHVLREYCRATGQRIALLLGNPLTHVEAIKLHACGIKKRMKALAAVARNHDELEREIQAFFGEAFFNILAFLAECQKEMPNSDEVEIRVEIQDSPQMLPQQVENAAVKRVRKSKKAKALTLASS